MEPRQIMWQRYHQPASKSKVWHAQWEWGKSDRQLSWRNFEYLDYLQLILCCRDWCKPENKIGIFQFLRPTLSCKKMSFEVFLSLSCLLGKIIVTKVIFDYNFITYYHFLSHQPPAEPSGNVALNEVAIQYVYKQSINLCLILLFILFSCNLHVNK